MVEGIEAIREDFMRLLKNLRERIESLESERAGLLEEVTELRQKADEKVESLEKAVEKLKKEREALKDILGFAEVVAEKP